MKTPTEMTTGSQTRIPHYLNPVAPIAYSEGVPAIHGVGLFECGLLGKEKSIVVMGATRVGKTRLAEVLITQDTVPTPHSLGESL